MKVTLVNLDRTATHAATKFGRVLLPELTDADATALLHRFRQLDAIENFESDPEIILESHRTKRLIRLNDGRLCLYNPANHLEAAVVLTPEEIVRELSFTAMAARLENPGVVAAAARATYNGPVTPRPRSRRPLHPAHRAALAAAIVTLVVNLLLHLPHAEASLLDQFERVPVDATVIGLAGVYVTGNEPGDHGIVIGDDGDLKLFRLNRTGAPDLLRERFEPGRIGRDSCLLPSRTRIPIWTGAANTLTYCGETYRRVQ